MSRLTNQIRQSLLKAVLDHAFSEKQSKAKSDLVLAGGCTVLGLPVSAEVEVA